MQIAAMIVLLLQIAAQIGGYRMWRFTHNDVKHKHILGNTSHEKKMFSFGHCLIGGGGDVIWAMPVRFF